MLHTVVIVAEIDDEGPLDLDDSERLMYERASKPLEDAGCTITTAVVIADDHKLSEFLNWTLDMRHPPTYEEGDTPP